MNTKSHPLYMFLFKTNFLSFIISYVYGWLACMYIYVPHVCSGCQKRVLDPLELELQLIVSFCVGNGLNLGPPGEQQSMVLTAVPSLKPLFLILKG